MSEASLSVLIGSVVSAKELFNNGINEANAAKAEVSSLQALLEKAQVKSSAAETQVETLGNELCASRNAFQKFIDDRVLKLARMLEAAEENPELVPGIEKLFTEIDEVHLIATTPPAEVKPSAAPTGTETNQTPSDPTAVEGRQAVGTGVGLNI